MNGSPNLKNWKNIPKQAFLYFPKGQQIKEGKGKQFIRRIFQSGDELQTIQKQKLKQLNDYLKKQKIILSNWYTQANKLRMLLANKFDVQKSVAGLIQNNDWRIKTIPIKSDKLLQNFKKTGAIYLCGRDNCYRPILVVDLSRFDLDNDQYLKKQFISRILGQGFEFMLNEMLIEGQVENYIIIINLNQIGIFSVAGIMKTILGFTGSAYRSRLYKAYIINPPGSLSFGWSAIKSILPESTLRKINICNGNSPQPLFKHCNKNQVQKKYGGNLKNLQSGYWPPKQVSSNYLLQNENRRQKLIDQQQYNIKFSKNQLKDRKINKQIIDDKLKKQIKITQSIKQTTKKNDEPTIKQIPKQDNLNKIVQNKKEMSLTITQKIKKQQNKQTTTIYNSKLNESIIIQQQIQQSRIQQVRCIKLFFQKSQYKQLKKIYFQYLHV